MNSHLLQKGSTPTGSQVCRTLMMLPTWDSKGVQRLQTSKVLKEQLMKNLKGVKYE